MKKAIVLVFLPLFTITTNAAENMNSGEDPFWQDVPTVLTPARLKQNIADVPASVTVITGEELKALGIRTVAEALRLVPGVVIGIAAGNDHRLEYGGTNGQTPRRMLVMMDGMSVFGTNFSRVFWDRFEVSLDDIDRIEVTRSPNSASYGANAFFGVVNIITRHPADTAGITVSTYTGNLNTKDILLRYSNSFGATSYRITAEHQEDSGFDRNFTGIEDRRDSTDINRLTFRSITELGKDSTLDIHAGMLEADLADEFEESRQITFPDDHWENHFIVTSWDKHLSEKHNIKLKAYMFDWDKKQEWRSCYPTILLTPELRALQEANFDYANTIIQGGVPSGGSAEDDALAAAVFSRIASLGGVAGALAPTCGDVDQNVTHNQYDLEFQDIYVFNDDLRIVSGLGARRDTTSSMTFFNGNRERISARAFFNVEYSQNEHITWNVGGMAEQVEHVIEDPEFSPRIAFNYHINPQHTVKLIASKAIRTPDFLATARDWNYLFRNLDPQLDGQNQAYFFLRQTAAEAGDDTLKPEKIESHEIVYFSNLPEYGLSFDLKLYESKLTDLISEDISFFTIDYTNDNKLRLTGAEFQAHYSPTSNWWVNIGYAHNNNDSDNRFETSIYAEDSGSFRTSYAFNNNWSAALGYYAHITDAVSFYDYHRTDLVITYKNKFETDIDLTTSLIIRNQPRDQVKFFATPTFTTVNTYDEDTHYYVSLDFHF